MAKTPDEQRLEEEEQAQVLFDGLSDAAMKVDFDEIDKICETHNVCEEFRQHYKLMASETLFIELTSFFDTLKSGTAFSNECKNTLDHIQKARLTVQYAKDQSAP